MLWTFDQAAGYWGATSLISDATISLSRPWFLRAGLWIWLVATVAGTVLGLGAACALKHPRGQGSVDWITPNKRLRGFDCGSFFRLSTGGHELALDVPGPAYGRDPRSSRACSSSPNRAEDPATAHFTATDWRARHLARIVDGSSVRGGSFRFDRSIADIFSKSVPNKRDYLRTPADPAHSSPGGCVHRNGPANFKNRASSDADGCRDLSAILLSLIPDSVRDSPMSSFANIHGLEELVFPFHYR
jgi:hypothetical protein